MLDCNSGISRVGAIVVDLLSYLLPASNALKWNGLHVRFSNVLTYQQKNLFNMLIWGIVPSLIYLIVLHFIIEQPLDLGFSACLLASKAGASLAGGSS